MELQPVAVLGIEGWITTPTEKMDNLFMHFVESNYSQTVTCLGQVYSFQYILNQFRDNPNGLVNEIKTKMSLYFSGYFKEVDITVDTIIDPLKQDTSTERLSHFVVIIQFLIQMFQERCLNILAYQKHVSALV